MVKWENMKHIVIIPRQKPASYSSTHLLLLFSFSSVTFATPDVFFSSQPFCSNNLQLSLKTATPENLSSLTLSKAQLKSLYTLISLKHGFFRTLLNPFCFLSTLSTPSPFSFSLPFHP